MSAQLAEQGSAGWMEQRCGNLTASRFADAVAKLKGGDWAASRQSYMMQLLAERMTGLATPHYLSTEMLFGIENEANGVAAYEWENDCEATQAGYIEHPAIPRAGATPDRFIGDIGLLEVKAPKTTTFIELRLAKEHGYVNARKRDDADDGYLLQCMWQLACCPARQWCDLAYYDPRMPAGLQLYVRRIERDAKIIAAMEDQAREFLVELNRLENCLRETLDVAA